MAQSATGLTAHLVDSVPAPAKGELWIADSHMPGFGLRVWRNGSGRIGKSYALRVRVGGRWVRKAIALNESASDRYNEVVGRRVLRARSLGERLGEAREIARSELYVLFGFPTPEQRWAEHRAEEKLRVGEIRFGDVLSEFLSKLRAEQKSAGYINRVQDLMDQFVPPSLKAKRLGELRPQDIEHALNKLRDRLSYLSILRSAFRRALTSGGHYAYFWDEHDFKRTLGPRQEEYGGGEDFLKSKGAAWIKAVWQNLEDANLPWQQTWALRLYFLNDAPLQQFMRARWQDLVPYLRSWPSYGTRKGIKVWRYPNHPRNGVFFNAKQQGDLEIIKSLGVRDFGARNPWWFPSEASGGQKPIRTVRHAWLTACARTGGDPITPRAFRSGVRTLLRSDYRIQLGRLDAKWSPF